MPSDLDNSTILVAGGAGFIGSSFVKLLLKKNHKVVNFDVLSYAANFQALSEFVSLPNYKFIKGDIRSKTQVKYVLDAYKPAYIVNFAAETHVDNALHQPKKFIDVNVSGTLNLLECYKNFVDTYKSRVYGKFIQISTDEVYGTRFQDKPALEHDVLQPSNVYSASKASSEYIAKIFRETYSLPILITRCCNNYGCGQHSEKLIPKTIKNLNENLSIPLYGSGEQIRQWIHVDDHCNALYVILHGQLSHSVYNIGADNYLKNIDLMNIICDQFDRLSNNPIGQSRKKILKVTDRPGHDFSYSIDYGKLSKETGWQPRINICNAISDIISQMI